MSKSKRFHVQLPETSDASLARLARARGMSKAGLARYVLLKFLHSNQTEHTTPVEARGGRDSESVILEAHINKK